MKKITQTWQVIFSKNHLLVLGLLCLTFLSALFAKNNFTTPVFAVDPQQAIQVEAQKVDLSLTPEVQNIASGQTFEVAVGIDGKTNQVTAADVEILFDQEYLEVQSVTNGTYLPVVLVQPATDNLNGKATLTVGANANSYPIGEGELAIIQFKALKDTVLKTKIMINPGAGIAVLGQSENMLGSITNTSVTIGPVNNTEKTATFDFSSLALPKVDEEFYVSVMATSNVDAANLFVADIEFDPMFFEIIKVEKDTSFVTQWVSDSFDNTIGRVSLAGGVSAPGYISSAGGSEMARVYVKAKKAGLSNMDFLNSSVIYRNSDNQDILSSTSPLNIEVQSEPISTPTPSPTVSSTPTPTPTVTSTPTPSPSATPVACVISNATWVTTGPVYHGTLVNLTVMGTAGCDDKQVQIVVKEDDGLLGTQNVATNPVNATFNGSTASTSWVGEYQEDGIFGVWDPPEYYFLAQATGDSADFKSTNKVTVNKLLTGQSPKGDGDFDGSVGWRDLSIMFTNWNQEQGFPVNLDMNDDGVINSFDFSAILQLLEKAGVI